MAMLFLLLCGMIGAYRYFTNSTRVRTQAEQYLAKLTGGHVTVGAARLSIFEGLRLDDVRIYVSPAKTEDTRIFRAGTFLIQYSPAALLRGTIEANRIVAIDPQVRLVEDSVTHQWNYSLLRWRKSASSGEMPRVLPEISLRNAMLDYLETGKEKRAGGSVSIDAHLAPKPGAAEYTYSFQSRAGGDKPGPRAEGTTVLASGKTSLRLYDLDFVRSDLRGMLPAQVREWWQAHELNGRISEMALDWNPSDPQRQFSASIRLQEGALTAKPGELLSREENLRRRWTSEALQTMPRRMAGMGCLTSFFAVGGCIILLVVLADIPVLEPSP